MPGNMREQVREKIHPQLWSCLRSLRRWIASSRRGINHPLVGALRRYWYRAQFKRQHSGEYTPRVGMHAIFIARENVLFLEEWILYHKSLGIEYFYLYDNSRSQKAGLGFYSANATIGKVAKRGIPYAYLNTMNGDEIRQELERFQREIPNVHIYEWSPVDDDGVIHHGQTMGQTMAAHRHRDEADWMFFTDMDEYLVPGVPIAELCTQMTRDGYVGAEFWEVPMDNRYRHLDKNVCDIVAPCAGEHPPLRSGEGKILCYLPRIRSVSIHEFTPFSPRMKLSMEQLHYRHYKCHHTRDATSTVPPLKLPELTRTPEWKMKHASPDWREVMENTRGPDGYIEAERLTGLRPHQEHHTSR